MKLTLLSSRRLVTDFPYTARCDRCDSSLEYSLWNEIRIVLSVSRNVRSGFVCIKCISNPKATKNIKITPEELDEFSKTVIIIPKPKPRPKPQKPRPITNWMSYRCYHKSHSECKGGLRQKCVCKCHKDSEAL